MNICDYGCGQEAKYQFKNGKWCCSDHWLRCENQKSRYSGEKNPFYNCTHTEETKKILRKPKTEEYKKKMSEIKKKYKPTESTKRKISKAFTGVKHPLYGKPRSKETREKIRNSNKITIEKINIRYTFFSRIEDMRYNPDKPDEKEIQVHCKHNKCKNSKEKSGWFTPTKIQLSDRIRALEAENGSDGAYLYCSENCKNECVLYNVQSDPYKEETEKLYTQEELEIWKSQVKILDKSKCQICGTEKDIQVHHIIPKKLQPFFALDPVNGICLCKACHYKYGHKDECNTWNLAQIVCKNRGKLWINI